MCRICLVRQRSYNNNLFIVSVILHRIYSCCCTLNKLDALTNGTMRFIETLGPLVGNIFSVHIFPPKNRIHVIVYAGETTESGLPCWGRD